MKKFFKIIIQNNENEYIVYDDILKSRIDVFPKDEDGRVALLDFIDFLLDEEDNENGK